MQSLFQDLRYAFRQLIHSPGFSLTAVIRWRLGSARLLLCLAWCMPR